MHLAAGLSVGLAGVAAGYTIGVVGDAVSSHCEESLDGSAQLLMMDTGCSCVHAAISSLCRYDSYLDFWRGSWSLRVCAHPLQQQDFILTPID